RSRASPRRRRSRSNRWSSRSRLEPPGSINVKGPVTPAPFDLRRVQVADSSKNKNDERGGLRVPGQQANRGGGRVAERRRAWKQRRLPAAARARLPGIRGQSEC